MSAINPSLLFDGDCEAALNFYKQIFGGEISFLARHGDSPAKAPPGMESRVIHAELEFFGGKILACDSLSAPKTAPPGRVSISVQFESEEKIRQCFADLQAGRGAVVMPLEKKHWNALWGIVADRFGIHWELNHFLPDD